MDFTVHLYDVQSNTLRISDEMSIGVFLQSFMRFIAQRGKPTTIYSDNGRNFVGEDKAISEIDSEQISAFDAAHKIRRKFNLPTAVWQDGWWEQLMQMLKCIMENVLGRASLAYEELVKNSSDVKDFDVIDAQELNKRIKATYSRTPSNTIPY